MTGPAGSSGRRGTLAVSGVAASASAIGLMATSGWLITTSSLRPPVLHLAVAIGLVQAFSLGRGLARYAERLGAHGRTMEYLGRCRLGLFDALEPLVPGGLPRRGSGSVLAGFVSDAETAAEGVARRSTVPVDTAASVLLGSLVAAVVDPALGILLLVGSAAAAGAAVLSGARSADGDDEAVCRQDLADAVVDTMRSARELLAYEAGDLVEDRLAAIAATDRALARRSARRVGAGRAAVTLLSGATLIALLGAGARSVWSGRLSGVALAVVAFVALAVADQLATLPAAQAEIQLGRAAERRLAALREMTPPVVEPAEGVSLPDGPLDASLERAAVSYGDLAVLEDLSVRVRPGERVALVGPSGSGKSTALHTLLHFVDCGSGSASLGGADVRSLARSELARRTVWMPADVHVFDASLADNLRIARGDATDPELSAVLSTVGLADWFGRLPAGLATRIGPAGQPMSAGEAQRLGLARALLGAGSVLLLDEPTAHVDSAGAPVLVERIVEASAGRTVLMVVHDPATAARLDRTVVLAGGRATEA